MIQSSNKTPFEIIRDENFNYEFQENLKWCKNLDDVAKYTRLPQTIIKSNSIIHLNIPYSKRNYNEKSKQNLKQFEEEVKPELKELKKIKNIEVLENGNFESINDFTKYYIKEYEKSKGKKVARVASKQTKNKILQASSVFVKSVISGFISVRGFKQRSISFCTFTLTEPQKHTDEKITQTFIDFIDHLKKVENYIIDPVTKIRTKEKALKLENYLWRSETQENGNIHFHLLADTFLNQDMLRRVWNLYLSKLGYKYGYGASNVNSLKRDKKNNKIKDVEKYLCKYLTKEPLKDKYKGFKRKDLIKLDDSEIYRRPILCKNWGCSRALLKLEYPKFYSKRAKDVFNKLQGKLKEYKNEKVPEYIKIFTGNIKKVILKTDYMIQYWIKEHYNLCYQFLYDEIPNLN